jgi:hypothetical protein
LPDLGEGEAVTQLKIALQANLAQQRERLFGWLSLLHEPALIRQVQDGLRPEKGATEKRGDALEIMQTLLTPALKAMLLPVLDQGQRLKLTPPSRP